MFLECRIILEFFCSYGVLNYYLGELNNSNLTKEPSLPVYFLDQLGYSKGGRGFVFILLMGVLKCKGTLATLASSWGYLKNLDSSRSNFVDDEDLGDADEARKEDVLNKKDLITVYFLTLKYIEYEIELRKGTISSVGKEALEIQLCLLGINKNHIESCKNSKCYCKIEEKIKKNCTDPEVQLLKRGYPKDTFDEKFSYLRTGNSIKQAIEYLEQQFENYVSYHGIGDKEIIYPYIKFLLLYSGKFCKAITLFNQKKRLIQAKNKLIDTNTDIEDINIIIQRVININQEDGSLYLLISSGLFSSELPQNTYLHPKSVILFLDSFQSLKTLCSNISDLKLGFLNCLLNSQDSTSHPNMLKDEISTLLKISIKKNLLYKVCSRLRLTQYWNYTPLLVLLSWLFGAIIEDEWGWGHLMKQVFKTQFKGFFSLETGSKLRVFKKKIGELGEEWEFKRDYDPVLLYVDIKKTNIYKRKDSELEIPSTPTTNPKSMRDKGYKRGFKINYVTKNSLDWLYWDSKDLIDQDVNVIIPQPFKGFHHQYMETNNINGSILMHKSVRPIVCELHDGTLYPVEIGIRIAYSLQHGFQFVGVLNFRKSSKSISSEDLVLSLDSKGNIIQYSKDVVRYFIVQRKIQQQVPELKRIFKEFDYITRLKNKNEELSELLGIELNELTQKREVDIPYKVMKRMKNYLPYSSEFLGNRVSESEVGSDKHRLQQNSRITLYNIEKRKEKIFEVTISDFWHRDRIEGRFIIFQRRLNEFSTARSRSLQFILTQNEYLNIWDSWEKYVYRILLYEQAKETHHDTHLTQKKNTPAENNEEYTPASTIFNKTSEYNTTLGSPASRLYNTFQEEESSLKNLKKVSNMNPSNKKILYKELNQIEENLGEAEALETRRFGTHSNFGQLRNQSPRVQSESSQLENAGLIEISEQNQFGLREWKSQNVLIEEEKLTSSKTINSQAVNINNQQSRILKIPSPAVDERTSHGNPPAYETRETGTTKSKVSTNPILEQISKNHKKKVKFYKGSIGFDSRFNEDSFRRDSQNFLFDTNQDLHPSVEKKVEMKEKRASNKIKSIYNSKKLLDRIRAEQNSQENNKPISMPAHSVTSTVISEYVKIKKTISYLVHYHPRLTLNQNKWQKVLDDNITTPQTGIF